MKRERAMEKMVKNGPFISLLINHFTREKKRLFCIYMKYYKISTHNNYCDVLKFQSAKRVNYYQRDRVNCC